MILRYMSTYITVTRSYHLTVVLKLSVVMLFDKIFLLVLVFTLSPPDGSGMVLQHPNELISSPPHYEFQYAVHNEQTGDIKDQFEHRRGDYVAGRYSLIEPDGRRRIVDYSSDPILGFTAEVRREYA